MVHQLASSLSSTTATGRILKRDASFAVQRYFGWLADDGGRGPQWKRADALVINGASERRLRLQIIPESVSPATNTTGAGR